MTLGLSPFVEESLPRCPFTGRDYLFARNVATKRRLFARLRSRTTSVVTRLIYEDMLVIGFTSLARV
ncbi:hypothetical protein A2U01_0073554 [Trifolium medium]|uniref:Uncharacterized protein n=1 Tax=Trifolium medium TaxID=97028 RepID=A0A392SWN1_9FABA|nr:hypothetical protein [Trifolium medium]